MKKSISIPAIFILTSVVFPFASVAQDRKSSFEEFRKGIFNNYNSFRKTILDHYADFLNGEWHEYESLNGEKRDNTPKPSSVPQAESVPAPVSRTPSTPPTPPTPLKPMVPPTPDKPGGSPRVSEPDMEDFIFYEIPMQLPSIDFNISYRLSSPKEYAAQWKDLAKSGISSSLLPAVKNVVKETGLNDYLTFRLLKSYIDSKFPQCDESSRMSAVHFLLANLGYDARIAMTATGVPLLLLPFEQTIYARNYMMMTDGKYYVFAPDDFNPARLGTEKILTCRLPADAAKGSKFNLRLGKLNIPVKAKSFDLQYGQIHLQGEVNENLMPILYHYPQMPISDYARSNVDPELRRSLVNQIKEQIGNLPGDEGVAELLKFMHNVFEYSTDENNHGFEKPYFIEETLYYPKNDCEDRAIFYTYFLWNALGREAQLVSFPGHEAATVRLNTPIKGTGYNFENETYFISDPTYIGSSTGMVMPAYRTISPKVDYTYK